ncbi:3-deoxy-7-phosphoheptulonate synthase [Candidatus Gracilibacteria bacterium]|nr:3-deoxy-7-phosphoheptulonate synthase [Candidatus Gracilibacteria bacterium]
MGYDVQKPLPLLQDILREIPLVPKLLQQVSQDRREIKNILLGKDSRKLLIIGPCSAWPSEAVLEYARKLKSLSEKVSSHFKIIIRSYLQKSRTSLGWLGPLHQPNPFASSDIEQGIREGREMFLEILKIGLPVSDEAVFLDVYPYFEDILSWVAIGARSSEDPEHRIFASGLDIPVGIKNPTSGYLISAVNAVQVAQTPHDSIIGQSQVHTHGNKYAHLILRGGGGHANYDIKTIQEVINILNNKCVQNKAIIVDASHENCRDEDGNKDPHQQISVLRKVAQSLRKNTEIAPFVKGFMFESFLSTGTQEIISSEKIQYGVSITDPCLGWEATEKCVLNLSRMLTKK